MGVFHGRRPISQKMTRPWNRELGWFLIMFSTCPFVRPSVNSFVCYQTFGHDINRFQCSANWHKWSMEQGHETLNFGVSRSKVKVTRPMIDLVAWQRQRSQPVWSSRHLVDCIACTLVVNIVSLACCCTWRMCVFIVTGNWRVNSDLISTLNAFYVHIWEW